MPNTNSAKKRLRQNVAARAVNRSIKSEVRTQLRKVHEAVDEGNHEKADEEFRAVAKKLDRAAGQNILHPNKAARLKSRLQKRMKAAKASAE
jgi:small subunit ribosomal protein S20